MTLDMLQTLVDAITTGFLYLFLILGFLTFCFLPSLVGWVLGVDKK